MFQLATTEPCDRGASGTRVGDSVEGGLKRKGVIYWEREKETLDDNLDGMDGLINWHLHNGNLWFMKCYVMAVTCGYPRKHARDITRCI